MTTNIELPVIGKVKNPTRWLIGLAAAGALVVGTTTYTLGNRSTPNVNIAEMTVPVESENITLRITASGKVVPVQNVNISPKNAGTLAELNVEQGDKVEQGQIIARMDSADIQTQIQQQRANLAQARAQLAEAQAGNRPQEIAQARARLAQAEAQLAEAKAGSRPSEVAQARARLAQAEAQLAAARAGTRSQEVAQAQAQVDSAKAQVDLTSARVERYRNLTAQGAVSQNELDQYISEDRRARASLEEAQRRLSLLKSGTRQEEITRQEAAVAEARAALQLLQNGTRPEQIARQEAAVAEAREALRLLENGTRPEEIGQRKAAVAAAEAQLKAAEIKLQDTVIRAPFAGTITQKYANVGAFVAPTTSASTSASATSSSIVALARGLEILAQVPEADIGRIKEGQPVEIVADAYPDQVFKGNVRLIAPEAVKEEGVTLFQVRVALDTGKDKLLSNMNVNLSLLGDKVQDALIVPTVAIVTEKGKTGVLVPDENNKPEFRKVTIGSSIKDQTQILEGVEEGDRIFINPPKDYQLNKPRE